jgi:hypothetical protein
LLTFRAANLRFKLSFIGFRGTQITGLDRVNSDDHIALFAKIDSDVGWQFGNRS